jgi:ERCC4-type nuclease
MLQTAHQAVVEIAPLPVGDYEPGGNPLRVAERKTAPDLVASNADLHLFAQAEALLSSGVAPLIVLEGDWSQVPGWMDPNAVRGALT